MLLDGKASKPARPDVEAVRYLCEQEQEDKGDQAESGHAAEAYQKNLPNAKAPVEFLVLDRIEQTPVQH